LLDQVMMDSTHGKEGGNISEFIPESFPHGTLAIAQNQNFLSPLNSGGCLNAKFLHSRC
jgi:hypothetical protein